MDTDEECSIVLELSKNNPFFDKKKLELYFAEDDACTSVEFYSPRNELEALNSIVLLTDISLSTCTHLHTNILQELRQTILDLISDFGDKNSVKGVVERGHSCDQVERLIEWGESNGVRTQLKIAYVEGAGRGAIARKDLKVGDIALEIPVSIIISEELVHETDMYGVLKEVDGISSETILLLWSMKEKYNCDSKLKIYFDSLPEKFNTGLSFSVEAITMLDGTLLLEEIMQARQLCPHIMHYGKVDTATNSLKFCLSRPCRSGEECCLSYGNFSNSHLITFYGFLPQGDNPYDVIPLDIDGSDVDSIENKPVSNWTNLMVRGTWLSNNHSIFYYGLPYPLLDRLRRSRSPMLQTKTFLQGNLENELEVLEDMKFIFDDMIDNMGEIDLDNRENCSWDEKLAMDFKNLQRRIASSVSTSCHTGVRMVKNELYKCMAEDIRG